jgi:hypothetical protein
MRNVMIAIALVLAVVLGQVVVELVAPAVAKGAQQENDNTLKSVLTGPVKEVEPAGEPTPAEVPAPAPEAPGPEVVVPSSPMIDIPLPGDPNFKPGGNEEAKLPRMTWRERRLLRKEGKLFSDPRFIQMKELRREKLLEALNTILELYAEDFLGGAEGKSQQDILRSIWDREGKGQTTEEVEPETMD